MFIQSKQKGYIGGQFSFVSLFVLVLFTTLCLKLSLPAAGCSIIYLADVRVLSTHSFLKEENYSSTFPQMSNHCFKKSKEKNTRYYNITIFSLRSAVSWKSLPAGLFLVNWRSRRASRCTTSL